MKNELLEISVVVPAYNEKENIDPLISELTRVLNPMKKSYEIIIIDDGSADGSREKLQEIQKQCSQVRVVRFKHNHGQTAALDAGFKVARGTYIIMMDADLQSDPADIPLLLSHLDRYDAVSGWRANRRDTFVKRVSSLVGNSVRNWITHENIHDTGASIKAFKRECVLNLKLYNGLHRFLLTLIKLEGYTVGEIKVNHRPRVRGTSKYNIGNRLFRGLYDLFAVRWMQKRQLKYREDIAE